MQLTPNFRLEEFLFSETAARMGREVEIDDPAIQGNILRWCETIGEPLRVIIAQKLGAPRPLMIISGYRPPWLNVAVGGSPQSAHMYGGAADIIVPNTTPAALARIVAGSSGLEYDQLILEFNRWVHIGIARVGSSPRHQELTAYKGGTPISTMYADGITEEVFA